MTQIKYLNYLHYKLPITINPLEYGKLIQQDGNQFIIQLNTNNLVIIKQIDNENYVKFYRKGDLVLEFKDTIISENEFIRSISDTRFTFKDNILIYTELKLKVAHKIIYYQINQFNSNKLFYADTDSILIKANNFEKIITFLFISLLLILLTFNDNFMYFNLAVIPIKNIIKLRKIGQRNIWNTLIFNINNKIFTKTLFENIFNKFWKKIQNEFTENNHMYILFKIKYTNNEFSTIGKLQKLSNKDKDWYINWIINNIEFKSEYYNESQIDSFIISYGFKEGKISEKNIIKTNLNFQNYNNNKLIISFNPLDFGKVLDITKLVNETKYILIGEKNFIIKILSSENQNIYEFSKDGEIIIKFKDNKLTENKFVREIDNKKYYFENNNQISFIKEMKTKFISKISSTKNLNNNFITLDIETLVKNNVLVPCCISLFDGKTKSSYILSDFKDSEELIITALKSILISKYNGFKIYVHNFAKFDAIFLLKYLVKLGIVEPIIHKDRLISINLKFGKNNQYNLQFKDSYLILLSSLAKLGKGFQVETKKSIFPFLFVNENNLDYIGSVPEYKYFANNINLSEYNEYKSNFDNNWNLKNEIIKYCEIDCISLYQIIFKFSNMIFNLFGRNIHHYSTLPSLAFAIFRCKFMDEENIPQLSGKISEDIRSGYTGGSVDMYTPENIDGELVYVYDVNSLYPYIMNECDMPIGKPTYFEGNIRSIDPNAFGFFYCKIIAPNNIIHPIIQTHVKTNGGIRTISPIGTWEDMIFSPEMDNAQKYGYKFEILWGYKFERKNIFKEYVEFLYNLRIQYPKDHPLNYIAKILLNSLYGRLGMDDNFLNIDIIHKDYYSDFENKFFDNILGSIELGDFKLIKYRQTENQIEQDETTHNVSISIAAAITAYARIHMSQFKNNPNLKLYYTDTDSIYTDKPLPDHLVSNKVLGKMKLENICKKVIFLTPKVYYLETVEGNVIYKVKGLKHEIELTMNDFKKLLYKQSTLQKFQTKWKRNLSEGHIKLLQQLYTLKVTDNKRQLIYNKNNKLIGTNAYKIESDKIINN